MASGISFSGLGSGIDTATIIEQLIQIDSVPITTMTNKQNTYKYKKELWGEVNSKVLALQESLNKLNTTLTKGTFSPTVTDENILGASITGSAISDNYNVEVQQLAKNLSVMGDKFEGSIGKSGKVILSDGNKEGKTFELDIEETDTLATISKKINNLGSNIKSYVLDGRLVLSNQKYGDESQISITDDNGIFTDIGLLDATGNFKNINQQAQKAIISVNGITVERSSNDINDLIPGVTLNLKTEGKTTIRVEDNVDDSVSAINDFIKAYNDTMMFIDTKLTEEIPETATTTNRKQGLLRGNSTLNQIKSRLRNSVLGSISNSGSLSQLYQIGIDSSKDNFGKDGTIQVVDETKLREALKDNRMGVLNLFIQDENDNGKIDENDKGLLAYLNNYINEISSDSSTGKGIIAKSMESLDDSISMIDKQIERKELQIEMKRQRYEKQFSYMETRVSNITANGEYLINSLASMMQN